MNKGKGFLTGLIFIIIGIFLMLKNFHYDLSQWILPVIGIVFIASYFMKRKMGFLITGLIILYIGLLDKQFSTSVFLIITGVVLFATYFIRKNSALLLISLGLISLGSFFLVSEALEIEVTELWPLLFMIISFVLLIVFVLEFKRLAYRPLLASILFFIIGVLAFLTKTRFISEQVWENLYSIGFSYWPVVLIIAGIMMLFNKIPFKKR